MHGGRSPRASGCLGKHWSRRAVVAQAMVARRPPRRARCTNCRWCRSCGRAAHGAPSAPHHAHRSIEALDELAKHRRRVWVIRWKPDRLGGPRGRAEAAAMGSWRVTARISGANSSLHPPHRHTPPTPLLERRLDLWLWGQAARSASGCCPPLGIATSMGCIIGTPHMFITGPQTSPGPCTARAVLQEQLMVAARQRSLGTPHDQRVRRHRPRCVCEGGGPGGAS